MIRATVRTSRQARRCITCDRPGAIQPGDRYRDVVMSPNHDGLGYPGWIRGGECGDCAQRNGRDFTTPTRPRTERVECDDCGLKVNVLAGDILAEHGWTHRGVKHHCDRSGTRYSRHAATFFCVGTPGVNRQWAIQCRCGEQWLLDATTDRSVDEVEAPWREHLAAIKAGSPEVSV